jgi:hypothetical protein
MAFTIPTSGKTTKPISAAPRSVPFTTVTSSKNNSNQLTPAGSVSKIPPNPAPVNRTLDSTGTATNTPTPVGKP